MNVHLFGVVVTNFVANSREQAMGLSLGALQCAHLVHLAVSNM
jgi:hypothetical protein